jgi:hypothetical protein
MVAAEKIYYMPGFGPRPRRKSDKPRDSQKSKVYAWEKALLRRMGVHEDRPESVERMVFEMSRHLGISPPKVIIWPNTHRTGANANSVRIRFFGTKTEKWLVAHELAHTYIRRKFGPRAYAGHGPQFVDVYIYLLERFCGVPANLSRIAAEEFGVKHGSGFKP